MSLDELSRKLEKGGASAETVNEIKQIIGAFFTKSNIEVKTRIPDADAWADMETAIKFVGIEFGAKYADIVQHRLDRFRIDVLSQTQEYIPSRDEVRDMVKFQKQQEADKGKSILERLQSGSY